MASLSDDFPTTGFPLCYWKNTTLCSQQTVCRLGFSQRALHSLFQPKDNAPVEASEFIVLARLYTYHALQPLLLTTLAHAWYCSLPMLKYIGSLSFIQNTPAAGSISLLRPSCFQAHFIIVPLDATMIANLSKAAILYFAPVLSLTSLILVLFAYIAPTIILQSRVALLVVSPSLQLTNSSSSQAIDGPTLFLGALGNSHFL